MTPYPPLQLHIPPTMRWDDQQLWELCANNRDLRIERNSDQTLSIMAPAGGETSWRNTVLTAKLFNWNESAQLGYVFDSSGGFLLPNKSMRAPDVAWIEKSRWEGLSEEQQNKFPPLCPDFVIELRSPSDALHVLEEKMEEWIENGCTLAWLLDRETRQIHIYRREGSPEIRKFEVMLSGEEVLPGFELDLSSW